MWAAHRAQLDTLELLLAKHAEADSLDEVSSRPIRP